MSEWCVHPRPEGWLGCVCRWRVWTEPGRGAKRAESSSSSARGWRDTATPAPSPRTCSSHPRLILQRKGVSYSHACAPQAYTQAPFTLSTCKHGPASPRARGAHTTPSCVRLQCTNQGKKSRGPGRGFPDPGYLELARQTGCVRREGLFVWHHEHLVLSGTQPVQV